MSVRRLLVGLVLGLLGGWAAGLVRAPRAQGGLR